MRLRLRSRLALLAAGVGLVGAQFDPQDGFNGFLYTVFQTEPSLRAPEITFLNLTDQPSRIQPGYLFMDPALDDGLGVGPLVYDTYTSDLIWDGKPIVHTDALRTQNSHTCDFDGASGYMCFTEFVPAGYRARHRVFDETYSPVGNQMGWNETIGFFPSNRHEFTMLPGGHSFLVLVYLPEPADLSGLQGLKDGAIIGACFQEIDAVTEKEIFRWCASDHGATPEKSSQAGQPHMRTSTMEHPWDYAHPNAMDKNSDGDYLISLRYFNSVWKIAGLNATARHGVEPGSILWKLGGEESDFTFDPPEGFHRWQHDCRFNSVGDVEERITLFDNHNGDEGVSAGKLYSLNKQTKVAKLLNFWQYPEPDKCNAMGSMRLQPNGNALIGWGQRPFFTEFDSKGEILVHGTFKNDDHNASFNYRVTKGPWHGRPLTKPKAVAYSSGCADTPLIVYMSWNGATEIRQWRISISSSTTRPWVLLGKFKKTGFETRVEFAPSIISLFSGGAPRYLRADALGPDGEVLGTVDTETFVPRPEVVKEFECDEQGCYVEKHFRYDDSRNLIQECAPGATMSWFTIFSLFLGAEGVMYTYRNLWPDKRGAIQV